MPTIFINKAEAIAYLAQEMDLIEKEPGCADKTTRAMEYLGILEGLREYVAKNRTPDEDTQASAAELTAAIEELTAAGAAYQRAIDTDQPWAEASLAFHAVLARCIAAYERAEAANPCPWCHAMGGHTNGCTVDLATAQRPTTT